MGVTPVSEEHDLMRKPALPGECLQLAPERAIARDDELCALSTVLDDPGGPQEHLESFHWMEAAHVSDSEEELEDRSRDRRVSEEHHSAAHRLARNREESQIL